MKRGFPIFCLVLAACAGSAARKKEHGLPGLVAVEGWAKASEPGAQESALADARREAVATAVRAHLSVPALTEASSVLSEKILSQPKRYLSDERIRVQGVEGDFYKVRLEAAVLFDLVGKDLRDAGILKRPSDVAAKTAVALDGPVEAMNAAANALMARGVEVTRRSRESFVSGREPEAARAAAAAKAAGVRMFVVGRASTSPSRALGSYDAEVRLWLVDADNAASVARFEGAASAQGATKEMASAKAVTAAAEQAADAAAVQILRRLPKKTPTLVRITRVGTPQDLKLVLDRLRSEEGVEFVSLDSYTPEGATASVWTVKKTAKDLAADLMRDSTFSFEVRGVLPGELELERK